jgi:hypothetical protein
VVKFNFFSFLFFFEAPKSWYGTTPAFAPIIFSYIAKNFIMSCPSASSPMPSLWVPPWAFDPSESCLDRFDRHNQPVFPACRQIWI